METEQLSTKWGIYRLGWEGKPEHLVVQSTSRGELERILDELEKSQRIVRGRLKYRLMEVTRA